MCTCEVARVRTRVGMRLRGGECTPLSLSHPHTHTYTHAHTHTHTHTRAHAHTHTHTHTRTYTHIQCCGPAQTLRSLDLRDNPVGGGAHVALLDVVSKRSTLTELKCVREPARGLLRV